MKKQVFIILILLLSLCNPASAVSVIQRSQDKWTCYDHCVNYVKENPDFGIVLMSDNQLFVGQCHYVNYKIVDDTTLEIYDGYWGINYLIQDWKESGKFYHFCDNEVPKRHWKVMQDNKGIL